MYKTFICWCRSLLVVRWCPKQLLHGYELSLSLCCDELDEGRGRRTVPVFCPIKQLAIGREKTQVKAIFILWIKLRSYLATNSSGVHWLKSALGIFFLFIGVSRVTLGKVQCACDHFHSNRHYCSMPWWSVSIATSTTAVCAWENAQVCAK